jgi:hypothetical protein
MATGPDTGIAVAHARAAGEVEDDGGGGERGRDAVVAVEEVRGEDGQARERRLPASRRACTSARPMKPADPVTTTVTHASPAPLPDFSPLTDKASLT